MINQKKQNDYWFMQTCETFHSLQISSQNTMVIVWTLKTFAAFSFEVSHIQKHDFRALHKVNVPIVRSPCFFGGDSPRIVGMFLSFIVTCVPKKTVCPNRSPHRSSFLEILGVSYLLTHAKSDSR